MITLSQISKRYPGGHLALEGIDLTIERGEAVALTGHSGAGKSTLLKLMGAIERPTGGTLRINGQDAAALTLRQAPYVRRNIGMVFQDLKLLHDRSVLDNLLLPLEICGFRRKEALVRAQAALDKVGLGAKERLIPAALSGGEQQRLCIARAIVNRPSILLADEPTANLDTEYARHIADLFQAFHNVGITIVLATHDEKLLARFPMRRVELAAGRLVTERTCHG